MSRLRKIEVFLAVDEWEWAERHAKETGVGVEDVVSVMAANGVRREMAREIEMEGVEVAVLEREALLDETAS